MTKKQALQKIEELKQFVEKCEDEENGFQHGDLVNTKHFGQRIIIDTTNLRKYHLDSKFLALTESGYCMGAENGNKFPGYSYTKIKNVFKDD